MNLIEIVAIVGGIVTILGAVVGVTARLATIRYRVVEENLKEERRQLKRTLEQLEVRNTELGRMLVAVKEVGSVALMKLDSITSGLSTIKSLMGIEACSIAIPNQLSRKTELVFLTLDSPQSSSIRRQRVPLDSIGGRAYMEGKPIVRNDVVEDSTFYNGVDKATGFVCQSVLALPLIHETRTVGVLYLVNKNQNQPFADDDISSAERVVPELADMVADFTSDIRHFDILGLAPDRPLVKGTIIFCDLSNTNILLRTTRPAEAIDRLNEYLSTLIQIGFDCGATAEMSVGGSFMLKFNISQPVENHALVAIAAGLEMQEAFTELKQRWMSIQLPTEQMFCRVGIESGPLFDAVLGHPYSTQTAVLGDAVEVARCLCDFADRTKNVVVIGESAFAATSNLISTSKIPLRRLGPARNLISDAYEVLEIRKEGVRRLARERGYQ